LKRASIRTGYSTQGHGLIGEDPSSLRSIARLRIAVGGGVGGGSGADCVIASIHHSANCADSIHLTSIASSAKR
jgi:hypothetical protein